MRFPEAFKGPWPGIDTSICVYDTRRAKALRQAATAYVGAMLEADFAGRPVRVTDHGDELRPEERDRFQRMIDEHLEHFLNQFSGAVSIPNMRGALSWDRARMSVNVKVWII